MSIDRPAWGIHGNTAAVERLQRAVKQGPRHAYLLSGPEFIGKSLLATEFAAALLCPNPPAPGESCGACSICRRVRKGVHPDVSRFDLAYQAARDDSSLKNTTLNIATVREVGRHVALRPVEASWRVVVIDDVETMQEPAQEAFLKTLEEPPSYIVILLLCADAELLLPTLLSRCAVVPMVPPPDATVRQALLDRGADAAVAERIAAASRGRVGLAIRALDDADLLESLGAHVSGAAGWISGNDYHRMAEAFRLADRFSAERELVFDRLMAVQAGWRGLLLDVTGGVDTSQAIAGEGALGSVDDGVRALLATDQCIRDLESNVRPRAAMATMVQAWPQLRER
jgi:DNA polymerase-3 subunit delta'